MMKGFKQEDGMASLAFRRGMRENQMGEKEGPYRGAGVQPGECY